MAQLLADFIWPWYEQNAQQLTSLYNVQLVNDLTCLHNEADAARHLVQPADAE